MRYILGDVEEVIDYRSALIVRSMTALNICLSRAQRSIVFDIVVISAPTLPQYQSYLSLLKKFTKSDSVILCDGSIGINYEEIVYNIIPDCIALTFTFNFYMKFIGDSTYYCDMDNHHMNMHLGCSIPALPRSETGYYEKSINYLNQRKDDTLSQLLLKLRSLEIDLTMMYDTETELRMSVWVLYNMLLTVAIDCMAICFDEYVTGYDELYKVSVVSSVYDELIYIALQSGAEQLHNMLLLQQDRYSTLNAFASSKASIYKNRQNTPPYRSCNPMIFNFMNYLESYALMSIFCCLTSADRLSIQSTALGFLYSLILKKTKETRAYQNTDGHEYNPIKGSTLAVPRDGFKFKGPMFKRKKRSVETDDNFFMTNDDDSYEEDYSFTGLDFEQKGFPKGYTGENTKSNPDDAFLRECLSKHGNQSLINDKEVVVYQTDRLVDAFRTMMQFDLVKKDVKIHLKSLQRYADKIELRDEIIKEYGLSDVLAEREGDFDLGRKGRKHDEEIERLTIDGMIEFGKRFRDDSEDSASLNEDAQEMISKESLTKTFSMSSRPASEQGKEAPHTDPIKLFHTLKLRQSKSPKPTLPPRSTKWLQGAIRQATLKASKQRVQEPQVFKKDKTFEFKSYNSKHQKIVESLDGVGEELVKADRYKASRNKSLYYNPQLSEEYKEATKQKKNTNTTNRHPSHRP